MLGRYGIQQCPYGLTPGTGWRSRNGLPPGMGATNMELASRIRWGGFSIAGIALTVAAVAFLWPVIKGYGYYRKGKKGIKKTKEFLYIENPHPFDPGIKRMGDASYKLKVIAQALGKPMTETTREIINHVYSQIDPGELEMAIKKVGRKKS
jgi:hypothetical protein